jgi:hypothetical protein
MQLPDRIKSDCFFYRFKYTITWIVHLRDKRSGLPDAVKFLRLVFDVKGIIDDVFTCGLMAGNGAGDIVPAAVELKGDDNDGFGFGFHYNGLNYLFKEKAESHAAEEKDDINRHQYGANQYC